MVSKTGRQEETGNSTDVAVNINQGSGPRRHSPRGLRCQRSSGPVRSYEVNISCLGGEFKELPRKQGGGQSPSWWK